MNKGKRILSGVLASSIMLLSGCSVSETAKSDKYDRAMATIGDQHFAFDIDNYNRIDNACIILYLEDGTRAKLHPKDVSIYYGDSEQMREIEKILSPITIEDTKDDINDDTYDRALVNLDDNYVIFEITKHARIDNALTILYLIDGTKLMVNPLDLVLYNSRSKVMQEVNKNVMGDAKVKVK